MRKNNNKNIKKIKKKILTLLSENLHNKILKFKIFSNHFFVTLKKWNFFLFTSEFLKKQS